MLTSIAPDLWSSEELLSFPIAVRLPARMTVVRLANGELLLHSPLRATPERVAAVEALGKVRHLVAPCNIHHLFLKDWRERHPDATLWGPPGLAEKRPDLRFDGALTSGPNPPWADELVPTLIEGAPKLNEVVLLHKASRSLLVADLVFHILRPTNLATSMVLRMMGTRGRLAMSRAWRTMTKDKAALRSSVDRVLHEEFDRVLPGHGAVVDGPGVRERMRAALAWAFN